MKKTVLLKKINRRKKLLNYLLVYFSPTNRFMVMLSQNLDKYITIYQRSLAKRYKYKKSMHIQKRKVA